MLLSGLGLMLITISTATAATSHGIPKDDLPLSAEELLLLQSAEAEKSPDSVSKHQAPTPVRLCRNQRNTIEQCELGRSLNIGEDLAQSRLPFAYRRMGPGDLSPVYQGKSGRRLDPQLDGYRIHHLFDTFDEQFRLNLFEPQNLKSAGISNLGLSLDRRTAFSAHGQKNNDHAEVWLQGGSFLRDYEFGLELGQSANKGAWLSQVSISRPNTGYFSIGQASKRRNVSFRAELNEREATGLRWFFGADFDQLLDVVRWDLNAEGRTLDEKLERIDASSELQWEKEDFYSEFRLVTIQNQSKRTNTEDPLSQFEQSSTQVGINAQSIYLLAQAFGFGANLSYWFERGQHHTEAQTVRGVETQLSAGLLLKSAWGQPLNLRSTDRRKAGGGLALSADYVWESRATDASSFDETHWRSQALFEQVLIKHLLWRTQFVHRKSLPNVGDLMQGADHGLESLWAIEGGPELNLDWFVVEVLGFAHWIENPLIRTWNDESITRGQESAVKGLTLFMHWEWTEQLGFESVTSWHQAADSQNAQLFGRIQVYYSYAPRQIYLELSLNQFAANQYSVGSHFRMPLGDTLTAQVTMENIFDLESVRPDSTIPEPELNVRALLRAHW